MNILPGPGVAWREADTSLLDKIKEIAAMTMTPIRCPECSSTFLSRISKPIGDYHFTCQCQDCYHKFVVPPEPKLKCPACGDTDINFVRTSGHPTNCCTACFYNWVAPEPEPACDPIEQAIAKHADKLANIVRAEVTRFLTLWAGVDRDVEDKKYSTSCTGCVHAYIPEEK